MLVPSTDARTLADQAHLLGSALKVHIELQVVEWKKIAPPMLVSLTLGGVVDYCERLRDELDEGSR